MQAEAPPGPRQQSSAPALHSFTSSAPVRQTRGSLPSLNPAHSARSTAGASSRPRYWSLLIATVGRMAIAPRPVPPSSTCWRS